MNSQRFRQFYRISKLLDKNALLEISGRVVVMIVKTNFSPSNTTGMSHGLNAEKYWISLQSSIESRLNTHFFFHLIVVIFRVVTVGGSPE
jgi:hypothetical protein